MKRIALVQGHKKECGVYQYGLSTWRILKKSTNYDYVFMPVESFQDFLTQCEQYQPDALLFNYDSWLLNWYNNELALRIQCPQFLIAGHQMDGIPYFSGVKATFIISPMIRAENASFFNIPRPIVNIPGVEYSAPGNPVKIGNFGFGVATKQYEKIIYHVNTQFLDEPVILNINMGFGDYVDNTGRMAKDLANWCRTLVNPNVILNISHDFLEMNELIRFLNGNDINIFHYAQNNADGLVSSSTDYALAAKKPIALNESSMFKHILSDDINIYKTPIKEIIKKGLEPLNKIYEEFSEDNFRKSYETVLNKFI